MQSEFGGVIKISKRFLWVYYHKTHQINFNSGWFIKISNKFHKPHLINFGGHSWQAVRCWFDCRENARGCGGRGGGFGGHWGGIAQPTVGIAGFPGRREIAPVGNFLGWETAPVGNFQGWEIAPVGNFQPWEKFCWRVLDRGWRVKE